MAYLLGIDNGGTMTKAAIFDERGGEVAVASVQTPLIVPKDGHQERDMDALWVATASCIREAIQRAGIAPKDIAGVGCCGHGKGLYLLGKDGKPAMNAIASTDRRAADIINEWRLDGTADAAARLTLQPVIPSQPVALLQWMKRERPEVLANVKWIFEAKDYIRYMLTGEAHAEETDYSGTSMMNLNTRGFDRRIMELFGLGELFDCLPPLCRSYDRCGVVTGDAARQTGLVPGTPVCGGMFDIDACAVAMGVTTPEKLCVITGTWSINEYVSDRPVRADTTTHNSLFCIPDTYLIEESSPTSAGNLNWFLDNFMKAEREQARAQGVSLYDTANAMVNGLPPEDSNVLFLPFLYGTNSGVRNACFVDLTNDQGAAHMLRAIYEGVAFCHYMHVENLYTFRKPPEAIQLAGGACNSPVWVQMFADVFGLPVQVVTTKELGAMGAAMAAAVAAGLYRDYADAAAHMVHIGNTVHPQPNRVAIYKKKYVRYKKLISLLSQLDEL